MKSLIMLALVALGPELVLGIKVHSLSAAIAMGLGSIAIFVLGYCIVVTVRLFPLFWESLEVDGGSYSESLVPPRDFAEVFELPQLPIIDPSDKYAI